MERKEEHDREGHKFLSGHVISMPTSQPQVQPERDFAPEDSTAEAGDFSSNIISEVEQQRVTTLTDTEDDSSTTTPKKKSTTSINDGQLMISTSTSQDKTIE